MMGTSTKSILYAVEVDQGGGRWLPFLKTESFEHAQAIAEDAAPAAQWSASLRRRASGLKLMIRYAHRDYGSRWI